VPGAGRNVEGFDRHVTCFAANLTSQVRAIAEVATAVTKGGPDPVDPVVHARVAELKTTSIR